MAAANLRGTIGRGAIEIGGLNGGPRLAHRFQLGLRIGAEQCVGTGHQCLKTEPGYGVIRRRAVLLERAGIEGGHQTQRLAIVVQGQVHFRCSGDADPGPRRPRVCRASRPAAWPAPRPPGRTATTGFSIFSSENSSPCTCANQFLECLARLDHRTADFLVAVEAVGVLQTHRPACARRRLTIERGHKTAGARPCGARGS